MIRRATLADAAEIARLIAPQGFEMDGKSVAANWQVWEGEGNFALVVDPVAQSKGYGRILVEAAEAELRRLGCGLIEVTSHQRRKEAHAFYRHLGFEATSFRFAQQKMER